MKIAQIMPEFGLAGAEIMCENLTYSLIRQEHTVTVVSLYDKQTPIAKRMEDAGASMVTVHGRTRSMLYSGTADWDTITKVKQQLSIPVIANGDIVDVSSALRCLKWTGADGIMIGRATFGDPWIFQQVSAAMAGQEVPERPILKDRIAVAVKQFELSEQDHGEHIACLEARKHFAWYLRGVRNASYYKKEITSMNKMEDIYRIAKDIVRDLE